MCARRKFFAAPCRLFSSLKCAVVFYLTARIPCFCRGGIGKIPCPWRGTQGVGTTFEIMNHLVRNARNLRTNATEEEKKLWYQCLNKFPVRFWRQKIIGRYIVDFCCPRAKLVVELDGAQHFDDEHIVCDRERDAYLSSLGYRVLRYTNFQINKQFKAVCQDIWNYMENVIK